MNTNLKFLAKKGSLGRLLVQLRKLQNDFFQKFGVADVISNSKIYEVLIANGLEHTLIPGHSGSRDALDQSGEEYEYKHFKELSSNHSWTFNDYSISTIKKLRSIKAIIFAHMDDTIYPSQFDWFYMVPGKVVSKYLAKATGPIKNTRKMINVSSKQAEEHMGVKKNLVKQKNGIYIKWLNQLFDLAKMIEETTGTKNTLTSNKIWEVLVAAELGHSVLSEQGGRKGAHDAVDKKGGLYEYKVSDKSFSWNFQDISERVLNKYREDKAIILAVLDKTKFRVTHIFSARPGNVVKRLKVKLNEKISRFKLKGGVRRLQVSLSVRDLDRIGAKLIYKS